MSTTDSPSSGSDPLGPVMSVTTDDVETGYMADPPPAAPSPENQLLPADGPTASNPPTDEAPVWEARYAFGNFAGRFCWGGFLILACVVSVWLAYSRNSGPFRVMSILLGIVTTCFWIWLSFRIVRARLSHQYMLTSHRLFVDYGIFRRQREMLELAHLKEVSISQEKFLDHIFKVGTVTVHSDVSGAPVLFLLGVKHPQAVMDSLYHHARD